MDAVSYAHSAKQESRIKKVINDPDSTSGIVTVPKVIASGETVTIPAGRVAVLPNVQVDGVLNVEGEVFVPSGATFGDLEAQIALKADIDNPVFTGILTAPIVTTKEVKYKATPITITSWSYVGTTITLNVASHTFVVGDYIEVSGLTATTYPANGIFQVTSVTATTIVFTFGATPTGTAGVSSATVKGYATLNGRLSESIGVNQTWQNVTASRLGGTTYYNTTGKPIMIVVAVSNNTNNGGMSLFCDGTVLFFTNTNSNLNANIIGSAVIPNGLSYSITQLNSTIATWFELR